MSNHLYHHHETKVEAPGVVSALHCVDLYMKFSFSMQKFLTCVNSKRAMMRFNLSDYFSLFNDFDCGPTCSNNFGSVVGLFSFFKEAPCDKSVDFVDKPQLDSVEVSHQ